MEFGAGDENVEMLLIDEVCLRRSCSFQVFMNKLPLSMVSTLTAGFSAVHV